jgi:glycosyltransferase involved in cell wall biosynthesis
VMLNKPRILIVSWLNGDDFGGSEIFWSQFIRNHTNEFDFGVFCREPKGYVKIFEDLKKEGTIFFFNQPLSIKKKKSASLAYEIISRKIKFKGNDSPNELTSKLSKAINQFKPDLVWINLNSQLPANFIASCPWPKNVPMILMIQAVAPTLSVNDRDIENIRKLYKRANLITFCTGRNFKDTERWLCTKIDNSKILGNFIDEEKYKLCERSKDFHEWKIISVGRLDIRAKGQDILIEAVSSPELSKIPWQLKLLGDGPGKKYLTKLISHYGIEDRVEIYLSENVFDELRQSDLFLLPSNYEGLSFSLLEAMATGLPCIVSDVAGQDDLVKEAGCGWVFSNGNPYQLKKALLAAWKNRENRDIGYRGHMFVYQHYESKKVMNIMQNEIKKMLHY